MIVLNTSTDSQSFTVIPRFQPSGDVTVKFVNESKNSETHSFVYAATYLNGVLTIANTFDPVLIKKNYYRIEITESDLLLWRGRSFITDQTDLPVFSINDGDFVEQTSNNEFIILQ